MSNGMLSFIFQYIFCHFISEAEQNDIKLVGLYNIFSLLKIVYICKKSNFLKHYGYYNHKTV